MADVFLSYKKEDHGRAATIVAALRKSGKSVWWDEGLTPRQAWDATIEREIADAAKVVVLWSPRSIGSDWVRTEAHYGQDKGKLVPVLIEPCAIPLAFLLRQAVDLSDWRGSTNHPSWRKLLGWLNEDPSPTELKPGSLEIRRVRMPSWPPSILVLATLLIVVAVLIGWRFYHVSEGGAPSVRVNALATRSGDAAAASFSQGFAADLAQIVTSGGSKLRVVDATAPGTPAARTTDFWLAGNVRSEGGNLRATLTLNSPEDGAIIWSTSLQRPLAQADAMHREAEVRMGAVFVCALDENARDRAIVPLDALKVYLQACEALPSHDLQNARKLLRDVSRLAPNFAQGWATLAEWNAFQFEADEGEAANVDRKEALDAAARALALDPRNATAWTARSMTKIKMSEWLSAQAALDQAFALNPDEPIGNYFAASHLRNVGRLSEALEHSKRGANSGPPFWPKTLQVIQIMVDLGDTDGAMAVLSDARKTWPDNTNLQNAMLSIAARYLKPKAAVAILADPALKDCAPAWRLQLYSLEFRARSNPTPTTVAAAMNAINTHYGGEENIQSRAIHFISIGRNDEAYSALERLQEPVYNAPYMANPSAFFAAGAEKFRADPRFFPLARKLGLISIWHVTGKLPDYCLEDIASDACKALGPAKR